MSSTESESGSGSEHGSEVSVDSNEKYSDNIRILHAGGEPSLSHQAALTFKYDISEGLMTDFSKSTISTRSHPTITEAYNSIKDSERNAGLIPFYNTLTGLYDETTDLLQNQQDFEPRSNNGSMGIKGEARIPIRHHLLVSETDYLRLKSIAPGESDQMQLSDEQLRGIGRIYGDELALEDCSTFLDDHCPLTIPTERRVETENAAIASQAISEEEPAAKRQKEVKTGSIVSAAIGPEYCVKKYGLKIARRDIQDRNLGSTRFFLIAEKEYCEKLTSKDLPTPNLSSNPKEAFRTETIFFMKYRMNPAVKVRTLFLLRFTKLEGKAWPVEGKYDPPKSVNFLTNFLNVIAQEDREDQEPPLEVLNITKLNRNLESEEGTRKGEPGVTYEDPDEDFSAPYLIEVGAPLSSPEYVYWTTLLDMGHRVESLQLRFGWTVDRAFLETLGLKPGSEILKNLGVWIY